MLSESLTLILISVILLLLGISIGLEYVCTLIVNKIINKFKKEIELIPGLLLGIFFIKKG